MVVGSIRHQYPSNLVNSVFTCSMPIMLEDLGRSPQKLYNIESIRKVWQRGWGLHFDFYNRLFEMGRARSHWDHLIFRGKQLSTQDWTFLFLPTLREEETHLASLFSNQNGLKLKPPPPPSLRRSLKNHQPREPPATACLRCLGHDFGRCLFSLFGAKGALWSFCSHVCLRSSRGTAGRVVDLGRLRVDLGMDGTLSI